MKRIEYPNYKETLYHTRLKKRLSTYFIHKPGFSKSYVTLSTPIGSIHQSYLDETGSVQEVPKGVAHFLEHKVFEKDGADISKAFSLQEASLNAFTEHNQTTYLFSATNHLLSNTQRLIEMFFYPEFTETGVEKEKNIITEELNMHLDDPYYKQYHGLINNLYHTHPIRDDILGTKQSIQAITLDHLRDMHEAYYTPDVATLVIVSGADANTVLGALESTVTLPGQTSKRPNPALPEEPSHVVRKKADETLNVKMPSVLLGLKLTPFDGSAVERIKDSLSLSIFLDLALGKSSDLYEALLEKGIINDTYGLEVAYEKNYAYALIGSETPDPHEADTTLREAIKDLKTLAISREDFNRVKRQMLGNFILGLDHPESLAYQFTDYIQSDVNYYDVLTIASEITLEEVSAQSRRLDDAFLSSYIVRANK